MTALSAWTVLLNGLLPSSPYPWHTESSRSVLCPQSHLDTPFSPILGFWHIYPSTYNTHGLPGIPVSA